MSLIDFLQNKFYIKSFLGIFLVFLLIIGCGDYNDKYKSNMNPNPETTLSALIDSQGFGVYLDPKADDDGMHGFYLCETVDSESAKNWQDCVEISSLHKSLLGLNKKETIEASTFLIPIMFYRPSFDQFLDQIDVYDEIIDNDDFLYSLELQQEKLLKVSDLALDYSSAKQRIEESAAFAGGNATILGGLQLMKHGLNTTEMSLLQKNAYPWQKWRVAIPFAKKNKHISLNFLSKWLTNIKFRNRVSFIANNKVLNWLPAALSVIASGILLFSIWQKEHILHTVDLFSDEDQKSLYTNLQYAFGSPDKISVVDDVTKIPWEIFIPMLNQEQVDNRLDEVLGSR